ncbi:MAG: hypothetical protein ABIL09_22380, partial [Gemmatimonadota bacterium]
MVLDLTDPGAAAVIDRHCRYWHNQSVDGDRPLLAFRQASPMTGSGESRPVLPPPPLDGAAYRDSVVQRYEREGLLDDDLVRMVSTGIPSEVLVGCAMTQRAGTTWAE